MKRLIHLGGSYFTAANLSLFLEMIKTVNAPNFRSLWMFLKSSPLWAGRRRPKLTQCQRVSRLSDDVHVVVA